MGDPPTALTRLPEQFGKYSILGHLATGGMAEVYLARAAGIEGFEKIVVIKRIRPDLTGDLETTGFFLDEARLVASLEHPNVAQVYDVGVVNGSYFFVMEYVHGADLRQLMDAAHRHDQPITLADAIYVIIGVCSALHYAHDKHDLDGHALGIIHRDVSPSNVLISHDGAVKVCDFGIAKAATRQTETSRGVLKGKFAYMSPEQCRSEPLDRRSDIFSIGILLYELSTLSRLFDAPSDYELLRKVAELPIPLPSTRVPGYPPALEAIVMRALSRDPAERYPTAQAMQLDLEALAREHKLALSSVHIARLMGSLFERRLEAWARAQREGRALGDHLVDTAVRTSGHFPVFVPIGSGEAEITYEGDSAPPIAQGSTPAVRRSSLRVPALRPSTPHPVRRRASIAWLVLAIVAVFAGGGLWLAGTLLASAQSDVATRDLEAAARRIADTFESAAHSAHQRADGIAMAPMLRAAIETDAATVADLAKTELLIATTKGESLELFQYRSEGKPVSLLRVPASAPALPMLKGREARVDTDGGAATVIASAPITGYKTQTAGGLVVAVGVDLAPVKQTLAGLVSSARLVGFDKPIVLVDGSAAGAPLVLPVGAGGDWRPRELTLETVTAPPSAPTWVAPAQWSAFGLGGLLALVYAIGMMRKPKEI